MQKNSDNFSMQEALRMANSPAGQQLLAMLRRSDPAAMQKAMEQASSGDYSQLSKTLAPFLESQDVKDLLKQIGGR